MRKLKRSLSLVALLLLGALLLTSCGADPVADIRDNSGDYIALSEADYTGIEVTANKTIVTEKDITAKINALLADAKTCTGDEKNPDTSGTIINHDVVQIHLLGKDEDGKVAFNTLNLTAAAKDSASSSTADTDPAKNNYTLQASTPFYIGYGLDTSKAPYSETLEGLLLNEEMSNHLLNFFTEESTVASTGAYYFFTYEFYTGTANGAVGTKYKSVTGTAPVMVESSLAEGDQGKNDINEMLARGLAALIDASEGKGIAPSTSTVRTINIIPTAKAMPDGAKDEIDQVYLHYDYAKDEKSDPVECRLLCRLIGCAQMTMDATPVTFSYTFGEDYTGAYSSDTSTKLAGKKVNFEVFLTSKLSYTVPDYEDEESARTFITENQKFAANDGETISSLKERFEAKVKTDIETPYIENTNKLIQSKLYDAVYAKVAARDFKKYPSKYVKDYVKSEVDGEKYEYYEGANSAKYKESYSSFDAYIKGTKKVDSVSAWKDTLKTEGEKEARSLALIYELANALKLSLNDEQKKAAMEAAFEDFYAAYSFLYSSYNPDLSEADLRTYLRDMFDDSVNEPVVYAQYLLNQLVLPKLRELNADHVMYTEVYTDGKKVEAED